MFKSNSFFNSYCDFNSFKYHRKILFLLFKSRAKKRLLDNKDLKIVAITASYGKTSIKNFLYHVLKNHFKTYKTPRSVNTIVGLVLDVNRDLPKDTNIYSRSRGKSKR
ncbi:hypothetical protein MASR2M54_03050 [Aliarcobacter cryaerophilus]